MEHACTSPHFDPKRKLIIIWMILSLHQIDVKQFSRSSCRLKNLTHLLQRLHIHVILEKSPIKYIIYLSHTQHVRSVDGYWIIVENTETLYLELFCSYPFFLSFLNLVTGGSSYTSICSFIVALVCHSQICIFSPFKG